MYNGLSGDLLFQVPTAGRRLSRTRFRRLCSRDLDIRWGHMLNDITLDGSDTGPATIHFEGKESATADVVIGADGANSRVRKWLVGEDLAKPEVSGHPMANGIMMCKTAEQSRITRGDDVVGTLAIMHGYMMLLTGTSCSFCPHKMQTGAQLTQSSPKHHRPERPPNLVLPPRPHMERPHHRIHRRPQSHSQTESPNLSRPIHLRAIPLNRAVDGRGQVALFYHAIAPLAYHSLG